MMNRRCVLIFSLLLPSAAFANDIWRDLDQISFSAVAANFIGTVEISGDNRQQSNQYKIYFRQDGGDTMMRMLALGEQRGEIIKTDSNVNLFSDSKKGLLNIHFLNFNRYPNFLPGNPSILRKVYHLKLGAKDKIANRNCQWYWLSPKEVRDYYSIGFCSDSQNYFPLTYVYKDSSTGKVIQDMRFKEISYQRPEDSQLEIEKKYQLNNKLDNPMSFSKNMHKRSKVNDAFIKSLPNDFYIISERNGDGQDFRYYYISNGLVYLSLFVYPLKKAKLLDLARKKLKSQIRRANIHGPINQVEYTDETHKVVLVGDMPFTAMESFILHTHLNIDF